jgi:ubiquitin C-terminal hydrolase
MFTVKDIPSRFIVQLDRNHMERGEPARKINTTVHFSPQAFTVATENGPVKFKITAVIYHVGSLVTEGHYMAVTRDWEANCWWLIDDANKKKIRNLFESFQPQVKPLNAYQLGR